MDNHTALMHKVGEVLGALLFGAAIGTCAPNSIANCSCPGHSRVNVLEGLCAHTHTSGVCVCSEAHLAAGRVAPRNANMFVEVIPSRCVLYPVGQQTGAGHRWLASITNTHKQRKLCLCVCVLYAQILSQCWVLMSHIVGRLCLHSLRPLDECLIVCTLPQHIGQVRENLFNKN